ncbi:MAG: acylphosphatase [Betaproteobacteria bacterium]|nr:acylphosphatase [Betaproteobacteria bacterium]
MSERVIRHLRIFGRVQGVWYRESMRQLAEQLGITGWVRNRLDGSVEALLQGELAQVERLIQWARRGPDQALVTHIDIDENSPQVGHATTFDAFLKLATC